MAETTCDELTATPAPCPLCCAGGGGGEVRSEDEPRKTERGRGKVFFRFVLISHYPTLILVDNKLISPSRVCFACDSNWGVFSLSLSRPTSFFVVFSPHLVEKGE